ncbi:3400_t:CDS:2, partial [Funneliformis geosporum]
GNSMALRRLAKANFPGMKGYNKWKSKKWLLYLDVNNLYGWAISQYLPTGGFRWLDLDKLADIRSISPTTKRERRIVKRTELSSYQNNDLIDKLSSGKFAETEKLVTTLETKDQYIIYYQNLQQCLELGMELEH